MAKTVKRFLVEERMAAEGSPLQLLIRNESWSETITLRDDCQASVASIECCPQLTTHRVKETLRAASPFEPTFRRHLNGAPGLGPHSGNLLFDLADAQV